MRGSAGELGVDRCYEGDPRRLGACVSNFVSNALKFSSPMSGAGVDVRADLVRSCGSTIVVGHAAMDGPQESHWDGLPGNGWVHTPYGSFLRSRVLFL